jgi:hypothetical protein
MGDGCRGEVVDECDVVDAAEGIRRVALNSWHSKACFGQLSFNQGKGLYFCSVV